MYNFFFSSFFFYFLRFRQRDIEQRGGDPDQARYPATAFPGPKEASGLPANIYAEKTNPMLSSATPGALATRQTTYPTRQLSFNSQLKSSKGNRGVSENALLEQQSRLNSIGNGGSVPSSVSYPVEKRSLLDGVTLPFQPPAGAMRGK